MIKHCRVFWGYHNGIQGYELHWTAINKRSVVLVSAVEGPPPAPQQFSLTPDRFVGAAVYKVENIAPDAGFVTFVVQIDWDNPLPLWTDVTVFDPGDDIRNVIVPY